MIGFRLLALATRMLAQSVRSVTKILGSPPFLCISIGRIGCGVGPAVLLEWGVGDGGKGLNLLLHGLHLLHQKGHLVIDILLLLGCSIGKILHLLVHLFLCTSLCFN